MKILLVNDDFPPESHGGAAVIVERLARNLAQSHEVIVVTTVRGKSRKEKRTGYTLTKVQANYSLRWRFYRNLFNPQTIDAFKNILEEYRPDVVNFHNIHTYFSYYCLKIAKDFGAKVIFTGHDVMPFYYGRLTDFTDTNNDGIVDSLDYQFRFLQTAWEFKSEFNPFSRLLTKFYLTHYTDHIVVVSDALKHVYEVNGIENPMVIYNGIDVKEWQVSKSALTAFIKKHAIPQDVPTLFYGGRVREEKGSLVAVECLCLNPELHLIVAGDDKGVAQVKQYARKRNVLNRLHLIGNISIEEMKYVYHSTKATIVPSICFDSFPNNGIEAMACGKPVILSEFAGKHPFMKPGKHLLTINPFNERHLKRALTFIYTDQLISQEMGIKAQAMIESRLTVKQWLAAYKTLFTE